MLRPVKLPPRTWEIAGAVAAVAVAFFAYDRYQAAQHERLRAELRQDFTTELTNAVFKVRVEIKETIAARAAEAEALPAVSLVAHNGLVPRGTGQIEIFNLSSTPAFNDSSGTRVTGELFNGTPRNFGLITVALVALDKHGHVLRRQQILFASVGTGDRRAFDVTVALPMSAFAAHRFELDSAR
jgi:hypothetical protein